MLAVVVHIKVTEGTTEQSFYLSKALLVKYAPHFPRNPREIKNISIATFRLFARWLNKDEEDAQARCPLAYLADEYDVWATALPLVEVYLFGFKNEVRQLCRDVLHRLSYCIEQTIKSMPEYGDLQVTQVDRAHAIKLIQYVYDNTVRVSPLRKCLMDGFRAADLTQPIMGQYLGDLPREFLEQFLCYNFTLRGNRESIEDAMDRLRKRQDLDEVPRKKRKTI